MPMKIVSIVLLCMMFLIEPAFAQAQFPYTGRVNADRVFVRSGQHVNYETIAVVNAGDDLVVLSQAYGWFKVKLPAIATAFIKTEHVVVEAMDIGRIKPDKLNVRAAPNTEAAIIGKLVQGARIYIREHQGEWLSIKPTDEMAGWVKEEFVERVSQTAPVRLYPEPSKVVAKPLPVMTPGFIKENAEGRIEVIGTLFRSNEQLVVKGSGVIDVVVVHGPVAMLEGFVNKRVKVTGNKTSKFSDNDRHMDLVKINLFL